MKIIAFFCGMLLFQFSVLTAQTDIDAELETAFQNAKKGVSWALTNIPERKLRLSHELISENRLVSSVKIDVEINGIKISSTGYSNSTEVFITQYRSIENLKKDGYLKNKKIMQPREE